MAEGKRGANPDPRSKVAVNEFTEAAFTGVLRALEARRIGNPIIIYGIILQEFDRERGALRQVERAGQ